MRASDGALAAQLDVGGHQVASSASVAARRGGARAALGASWKGDFMHPVSSRRVSRRSLLGATAGVVTAAAAAGGRAALPGAAPGAGPPARRRAAQAGPPTATDPLFRALDEKIETAMARCHVPGAAVGVLHNGREYVRGYGVTNVDYPQPV